MTPASSPLIALAGYARSGKDSAAAALVEIGWTRRAFADPIKGLALRLNPRVVGPSGARVPLQVVVSLIGWERAKEEAPGVRPYLQELGMAVRDEVGREVWIDAALRCAPSAGLVLSDCRLPNEAEAVLDRGGVVLRVNRDGVGAANGHKTEVALPDHLVTHEVDNNGSLQQLAQHVYAIAGLHFAEGRPSPRR